jgi:predicted transcriptional regulator
MKPTESELAILTILWKDGPSTVRSVNDTLNKERRVGYTNTLKIMQLMHEKDILLRDESERSHVYSPIIQPDEIRNNLLKNMVNSVFAGNTSNLLIHALGNYKPTKVELEEIKELIRNLEEDDTK